MPADSYEKIEWERNSISSSGDASQKELLSSLDSVIEKAKSSSQAMSVLDSIVKTLTSNGKSLHDCLGQVVRHFEKYDEIVEKSSNATYRLSVGYEKFGNTSGIQRINQGFGKTLSMTQSLEKQATRLNRTFSELSFEPPTLKPRLIPGFARGGRVGGNSTTGDRITVGLNSGEWVYNKKQVRNLAKRLGVSSEEDVFRLAGGNPGKKRYDLSGRRLFEDGGKASDALTERMEKTVRESNLEKENVRLLERQIAQRKAELENMRATSTGSSADRRALDQKSDELDELQEQLNGANSAVEEFAQGIEGLKELINGLNQRSNMNSSNRKELDKKIEQATQKDEKGEYIQKNRGVAEAGRNVNKVTTNIDNQAMGVSDYLSVKFNDAKKAKAREFNEIFKGKPTAMLAIGAAIVYATKQLANFIKENEKLIDSMSKLDIQASHLKANFDSAFGSRQYEGFRNAFALTREEMTKLGPTMAQAMRESQVSMEAMQSIASNIRNEFGELDTEKFNSVLKIAEKLTGDQMKALQGGGVSQIATEDTLANIASNQNAGEIADLLEQGVFGEMDETAGLNEGEKAVVKAIRETNKTLDEMHHWMNQKASPYLASLVPMSKALGIGTSVLSSISGTAMMILVAMESEKISKFAKDIGGKFGDIGKSISGKFSNLATPLKGLAKGLGPTMIVSSIFFALSSWFKGRSEQRKNERIADDKKIYQQTGLINVADRRRDNYAVGASAAKGAGWGALVGGIVGSIVPVIGPAVGIAVGSAIGGAIGGGLESEKENRKRSDPFWREHLRYQKIIHKLQLEARQRRKEMLKSLHLIESNQGFMKKLESGAFAGRAKTRYEAASSIRTALSETGGNNGAYGANLSVMSKMTGEKFGKEMSAISSKISDTLKNDAKNKTEALNVLLKGMADVSKKYREQMLETIGAIAKAPSIMRNELLSQLRDSINADAANQMVGTASMGMEDATRNVRTALDDVATVFEGSVENFQGLVDAQENAKRQFDNFVKKLQDEDVKNSLKKQGVDVDKIIKNGKVDDNGLKNAIKALNERQSEVDEQYDRSLGPNFSKRMHEAEEAAQTKDYQEIIDKTSKNKKVHSKEIESLIEKNNKAIEYYENDETIPNSTRENAIKELKRHNADLEGMRKQDKDQRDKSNFDRILYDSSNAAARHLAELKNDRSKFENSDEGKRLEKKRVQLEDARGRIDTISTLSDNSVTAADAIKTWYDNLNNKIGKVDKAAKSLVDRIETNATTNTYKNLDKILTAQDAYLNGMNRSAEKVAKQMKNAVGLVSGSFTAMKKAENELPEIEKRYDAAIEKVKNEQKDVASMKSSQDFIRANKELADYRGEVIRGKAVLDPKKMKELEDAVDIQAKQLQNGSKNEREFAQAIANASKGMNATWAEFETAKGNVVSSLFAFNDNLNKWFDEYKNSETFKRLAQREQTRAAEQQLAASNFDFAGTAMARSGALADTEKKYREEQAAIEETYRNALKTAEALRDNVLNNTKDEKQRKAAQQAYENTVFRADQERRKRLSQSELDRKTAVVKAAEDEYNAKKAQLDIQENMINLQEDLLSTIGGPAELIVSLEQQRLKLARETLDAAQREYDILVQRGTKGKELEEAKYKLAQAQVNYMKKSYGAQNSILEKLLGQITGAFGEVAGIMGPGNRAAVFGMGYTDLGGGRASRGGAYNGGYRDRLFQNSMSELAYAKGGETKEQVSGYINSPSTIGDQNLIRVNGGEWVYNQKQVHNLMKRLNASSEDDVFRLANTPAKENGGQIPKFATGNQVPTFSSRAGRKIPGYVSGNRPRPVSGAQRQQQAIGISPFRLTDPNLIALNGGEWVYDSRQIANLAFYVGARPGDLKSKIDSIKKADAERSYNPSKQDERLAKIHEKNIRRRYGADNRSERIQAGDMLDALEKRNRIRRRIEENGRDRFMNYESYNAIGMSDEAGYYAGTAKGMRMKMHEVADDYGLHIDRGFYFGSRGGLNFHGPSGYIFMTDHAKHRREEEASMSSLVGDMNKYVEKEAKEREEANFWFGNVKKDDEYERLKDKIRASRQKRLEKRNQLEKKANGGQIPRFESGGQKEEREKFRKESLQRLIDKDPSVIDMFFTGNERERLWAEYFDRKREREQSEKTRFEQEEIKDNIRQEEQLNADIEAESSYRKEEERKAEKEAEIRRRKVDKWFKNEWPSILKERGLSPVDMSYEGIKKRRDKQRKVAEARQAQHDRLRALYGGSRREREIEVRDKKGNEKRMRGNIYSPIFYDGTLYTPNGTISVGSISEKSTGAAKAALASDFLEDMKVAEHLGYENAGSMYNDMDRLNVGDSTQLLGAIKKAKQADELQELATMGNEGWAAGGRVPRFASGGSPRSPMDRGEAFASRNPLSYASRESSGESSRRGENSGMYPASIQAPAIAQNPMQNKDHLTADVNSKIVVSLESNGELAKLIANKSVEAIQKAVMT